MIVGNKILAIDPGPEQSAWIVWDGRKIEFKEIWENQRVLSLCRGNDGYCEDLVIEDVKSYGMAVGKSIFETMFWIGRFCEAYSHNNWTFTRVPRMDVKMYLCHSSRAKDANIRQALIDRFGEPGTKKKPGLTYGLKKDLWSAFALAITFWDRNYGIK